MGKEFNLSRRAFLSLTSGMMATQLSGPLSSSALAATEKKRHPRARPSLAARKNILFIFTDQERHLPKLPAGLSLPGHERLKRNGTTFDSHYVSATMCTSSRSVMLTGLQTAATGMFDNVDCPYIRSMSPQIPTIGHMLRKAGYYTAYQGKWHLGQEFGTHEPDKSLIARMDEYGFSDFFSPGDGLAHNLGGYYSDEMIASSAISWLRRKGGELSAQKKPWSLFVSLVNPHDIMYFNADSPSENVQDTGKLLMHANRAPQDKWYSRTWNVPLPQTLRQSLNDGGRPSAHGEYAKSWGYALGHIPLESPNWRRFTDFYFNSIRLVDRQINSLLSELDALGLTDDTIVIFTADHGEMGGHHGLRGKGPFAYEEAIHVPFYVVHPDVEGGQHCAALSSHIDIAPTLLSLAGVSKTDLATYAGRELPGKDLSSAISDPRRATVHTARESVLFTYSGIATNDSEMIRIIAEAKAAGQNPKEAVKAKGYQPNLKKRGTVRTVFDGRYKFSRYFAPTEHHVPSTADELYKHNDLELYDLASEPSEVKNLANDRAKHEPLVLTMNQKLNAMIQNEVGRDNGHELPEFPKVTWSLDKVDL